jgi:hypothetical protein
VFHARAAVRDAADRDGGGAIAFAPHLGLDDGRRLLRHDERRGERDIPELERAVRPFRLAQRGARHLDEAGPREHGLGAAHAMFVEHPLRADIERCAEQGGVRGPGTTLQERVRDLLRSGERRGGERRHGHADLFPRAPLHRARRDAGGSQLSSIGVQKRIRGNVIDLACRPERNARRREQDQEVQRPGAERLDQRHRARHFRPQHGLETLPILRMERRILNHAGRVDSRVDRAEVRFTFEHDPRHDCGIGRIAGHDEDFAASSLDRLHAAKPDEKWIAILECGREPGPFGPIRKGRAADKDHPGLRRPGEAFGQCKRDPAQAAGQQHDAVLPQRPRSRAIGNRPALVRLDEAAVSTDRDACGVRPCVDLRDQGACGHPWRIEHAGKIDRAAGDRGHFPRHHPHGPLRQGFQREPGRRFAAGGFSAIGNDDEVEWFRRFLVDQGLAERDEREKIPVGPTRIEGVVVGGDRPHVHDLRGRAAGRAELPQQRGVIFTAPDPDLERGVIQSRERRPRLDGRHVMTCSTQFEPDLASDARRVFEEEHVARGRERRLRTIGLAPRRTVRPLRAIGHLLQGTNRLRVEEEAIAGLNPMPLVIERVGREAYTPAPLAKERLPVRLDAGGPQPAERRQNRVPIRRRIVWMPE